MKINPINQVQNIYRKQIDKQERLSSTTAKRDQIEISNVAKELQQSNKVDEARLEKINHIKEQIETGNYKVDPKAVARKFYEYWTNQ